MYRPITTFVNMEDFPLGSGGNLMRCGTVVVKNQCFVLFLVRRKRYLDEVRVRNRVVRDKFLYFLHESISFGS